MPPKQNLLSNPQSSRTLYQIFIYDGTISRFWRFAWEATESPLSLKRAAQIARNRPSDVETILNTLSGLDAVRHKYAVCDDAVPCAHCGGKEDRVELRFDFQHDTRQQNGPFVVSVIAVPSHRSKEVCLRACSEACWAKLEEVAQRVRERGSRAWWDWPYAADENAGGANELLYLVHRVVGGNGEEIARSDGLIFFPDRAWNRIGNEWNKAYNMLSGALDFLRDASARDGGGDLQACALCGKPSPRRLSSLVKSGLNDVSALEFGANKSIIVTDISVCAVESGKCAQHASRVLQARRAGEPDDAAVADQKGHHFHGALTCAFCGVRETSGVMGSERIKLKRCGKCMLVYYCSSGCQLADWPAHKTRCKKGPHNAENCPHCPH